MSPVPDLVSTPTSDHFLVLDCIIGEKVLDSRQNPNVIQAHRVRATIMENTKWKNLKLAI